MNDDNSIVSDHNLTLGAIKPGGGVSPERAKDLIRVPEMKSKSPLRLGSKNAIFCAFISYAATRKGMISKC